MNPIRKTFTLGRHQVTLETGEIARQADGAVMVSMEDTVVLVTCVALKKAKVGQDFFPLTVDYQERFYASGRIPVGLLQTRRASFRKGDADFPSDRSPIAALVSGRVL